MAAEIMFDPEDPMFEFDDEPVTQPMDKVPVAGQWCYFHGEHHPAVARNEEGFPLCRRCLEFGIVGVYHRE